MAQDTRKQGTSYGYVLIPEGGITIDGVTFKEGPKAAGKSGWFKLLRDAGCAVITQGEYERLIGETGPEKESKNGKRPRKSGRDQVAV